MPPQYRWRAADVLLVEGYLELDRLGSVRALASTLAYRLSCDTPVASALRIHLSCARI
jgi:hypothetical protein